VKSLFGTSDRKKSKKEEQIDRKIEVLLDSYKKIDENLLRKAKEKELTSNVRRKVLRDKFGFSDDEEEDEEEEEEEEASSGKPYQVKAKSHMYSS